MAGRRSGNVLPSGVIVDIRSVYVEMVAKLTKLSGSYGRTAVEFVGFVGRIFHGCLVVWPGQLLVKGPSLPGGDVL